MRASHIPLPYAFTDSNIIGSTDGLTGPVVGSQLLKIST
tara:strand:+ start:337 stop:453 length:117 start_codon:yes stop_codon:yes gene_type:complete